MMGLKWYSANKNKLACIKITLGTPFLMISGDGRGRGKILKQTNLICVQ